MSNHQAQARGPATTTTAAQTRPINVTFEIPLEPVAKGRPRAYRAKGGNIRMFTPDRTHDFEASVATLAALNCPKELIDEPVRVDILAVFRRTRELAKVSKKTGKAKYGEGFLWHTKRPDRDNIAKAVLDGMQAVWRDDSLVVAGETVKVYAELHGKPRVVVKVSSLHDVSPSRYAAVVGFGVPASGRLHVLQSRERVDAADDITGDTAARGGEIT